MPESRQAVIHQQSDQETDKESPARNNPPFSAPESAAALRPDASER
jgi:hypothetical protein